MESNSVCNHRSDNKIGLAFNTSSIIKITIFEKRIAKLSKKEKICIKNQTKEA